MEISGLEPKLTKCKFAVLPIKLYPLFFILKILEKKTLAIRKTTWTFMININEA